VTGYHATLRGSRLPDHENDFSFAHLLETTNACDALSTAAAWQQKITELVVLNFMVPPPDKQ